MTSTAPLVAISHPRLAMMQPALQAQGWRVGLLWDAAFEDRADVRALVHLGEHRLPAETLLGLPALGLIANIGVGYDGVDVPWCTSHGIAVTHASGLNTDDVADHAIGLLLASWRGIAQADRFVRSGDWSAGPLPPRPGVGGRTLGIVGLGAIGQAVAMRAVAFGLHIAWWGPNPKPSPWPRAPSLLALAEQSDILVVACRAEAGNAGLISAPVIEALGPRGLLVNVARGSVVDEPALIAALRAGRLGQAALDVFAQEPTDAALWAGCPNALLTPHVAGATSDSIPRLVAQAVANVDAFFSGAKLQNAL